jgi:hypothetical protein
MGGGDKNTDKEKVLFLYLMNSQYDIKKSSFIEINLDRQENHFCT